VDDPWELCAQIKKPSTNLEGKWGVGATEP
jgi:hypothetical protein